MIVLIDRVFVLAHPALDGRSLKVGSKYFSFFGRVNFYFWLSSNVTLLCYGVLIAVDNHYCFSFLVRGGPRKTF